MHRHETYWLRFTRLHLDEVNQLLDRYRSCAHDEHERVRYIDAILTVLRPLIDHAALSNYQHRSNIGLEVEDFRVFVEIAVYKAVVSYEPSKNDNFIAYLYRVVNNETLKHLDSELPISPSLFHRLSDPSVNEKDARTCSAILHASSLSDCTDRDVSIGVLEPAYEKLDSEWAMEQDGQLVIEELLA